MVSHIALFQIFAEKGREFVKGDVVQSVVQIHMTGAGNDVEFFGLGGQFVGVFAEFSGMSFFTRDEKHGTRRDRLDVIERVKIHEFDVAGKRRVRCKYWRQTFGSEFTSWSAVKGASP
jgi:hypothetical protein